MNSQSTLATECLPIIPAANGASVKFFDLVSLDQENAALPKYVTDSPVRFLLAWRTTDANE